MNEPEFRLIQPNDFHAFNQLIIKNRDRIKRYFPITVSKTNSLEEVKKYLLEFSGKWERNYSTLLDFFMKAN